ncbi:Vacuolar protein sorting-associated protein 41 [Paramarasmius palmivorus]|uniref:Vacuolar protein sorting-associated protein 41 n=1 Tax=Paramarasmius palmivorus TaxID=297713 RepID=A0AAW0CBZ1_9AGAR
MNGISFPRSLASYLHYGYPIPVSRRPTTFNVHEVMASAVNENGHADSTPLDDDTEKMVMSESPTSLSDGGSSPGQGEDSSERADSEDGTGSVEEDSDEVEDDEDDDEDEDDEEPALKYERLGGNIPDIFKKDSGSAIAMTKKYMRVKSYKPHLASVIDISVDSTGEFIGTASMDGQVVVISLTSKESYSFDLKRPMRTLALEPNFGKRSSRALVYGGLAGALVLREKGWLGHSETTLHLGEGPIWQARWHGRLIAWANDLGVKIYDTESQQRITFIDRLAESPRADLFKCTLYWQDDSTLLIAWADHIKVARIRARPRTVTASESANLPPLLVEITAVFQLDCMVAGIIPILPIFPTAHLNTADSHHIPPLPHSHLSLFWRTHLPTLASRKRPKIVLGKRAKLQTDLNYESSPVQGKSLRPMHLALLSTANGDAMTTFSFGVDEDNEMGVQGRSYVVLSPQDVILVRQRDRLDHVAWLMEKMRYAEALEEIEAIEAEGKTAEIKVDGVAMSSSEIGLRYLEYLVGEGDFVNAAQLCPKVCARDSQKWQHWIFFFAGKNQLQAIIPYIPTENPRLERLVYDMILAHFLAHDPQMLSETIKEWPKDIYDIGAVIIAVLGELERTASSSSSKVTTGQAAVLMECLAELYTANRQPGKALPYFLHQILLLVEFDHELMEKRRQEKGDQDKAEEKSEAIQLLVDNVYSIPITRVVQQLQPRPQYLFLYLDSLMEVDPQMISGFPDLQDLQVKLYADYARPRLIDFLRASSEYDLEKAYAVCQERDLIPEMVFLLGRMGNNKKALTVIIERLGDVHRAIDFAKEQADDDLWEDLLKYSETRPNFIRGLLENVGPEINPIRLIRRIKNGLEIPGLKEALIKILQDFHLQISLLEGCQTILDGDSSDLSKKLQRSQTSGFFLNGGVPIFIDLDGD